MNDSAIAGAPTVMDRLKHETQDLHTAAERHPFQAAFVRGLLPREAYIAYLGQMLLVHRVLEARLRAAAPSCAAIARVVRDEQHQEPYLLADLGHFGVDPGSVRPLPATGELIREIEAAADPLTILGFHYVLEGSNNGNAFIAKAVRRVYGLTPGQGDRYLDPYGERQRGVWAAFKADMNAVGFTSREADTLVAAAGRMFRAITAISEDLHRAHAAQPA